MQWGRLGLLLFLLAFPPVIGAPSAVAADSDAVAALIDEQGPLRHPGSVQWLSDRIGPGGQPTELVVLACVEIPDLKTTVAVEFRRNTDGSLPATHLVRITFMQPGDVTGREVEKVPGMLLKVSELAEGTPLAALSAKISKGSFLIGLSNKETDRSRNLQLLGERHWFDIPLNYADQRRAILTIEKGPRGDPMFQSALAEWERPVEGPRNGEGYTRWAGAARCGKERRTP